MAWNRGATSLGFEATMVLVMSPDPAFRGGVLVTHAAVILLHNRVQAPTTLGFSSPIRHVRDLSALNI